MPWSHIAVATALALTSIGAWRSTGVKKLPTEDRRVVAGRAVAPINLDFREEDAAAVYLGSYLVNAASGCVDCHSCPTYTPGDSPFKGGSGQLASAHYLGGGTKFPGNLVAPGLTPDEHGNPAGLTEDQFFSVMRTGRAPDDPTRVLQAMPWPLYRHLTDDDLHAMYAYLRALPHAEEGTCGGPGE